MNRTEQTAEAIIDIIGEHEGQPVLASEMRDELTRRVGTHKYLGDAATWLRNGGVLIVADRARHNTVWRILDPSTDGAGYANEWAGLANQDALSRWAHQAQALGRSTHIPAFADTRNRVVASAIHLGASMGMDAMTVLAMCEPVQRQARATA